MSEDEVRIQRTEAMRITDALGVLNGEKGSKRSKHNIQPNRKRIGNQILC
jgi:hypothetical protein